MKRSNDNIIFLLVVFMGMLIHQSCTHDPTFITDTEPEPMDTMTLDTMMIDTTQVDNPCDSNLVYFNKDILPIFVGSCAFSGCHDVTTATKGIILDSYDNTINTTGVVPFDLSNNEIYEVITENDPSKVMPPGGKLNNTQIDLIAKWILQGADSLNCDEDMAGCDTQDISYNEFIKGVMATYCNGCHSTNSASGGIVTDTYENMKVIADNGRLLGSINWDQAYINMPLDMDQLDVCTIDKIKSWIDAGAQNN